MRIESTEFTGERVVAFLDELFNLDRQELVARLRRASARLELLGSLMSGRQDPVGDGWTPLEILAHIAVLSKFYGVLTYRIATAQISEVDFLAEVKKRDVLGHELSQRSAEELVEMALIDHKKTIDFMLGADAELLRRKCQIGAGRWLTAEEVARVALCTHLEQHLDQLERSVVA